MSDIAISIPNWCWLMLAVVWVIHSITNAIHATYAYKAKKKLIEIEISIDENNKLRRDLKILGESIKKEGKCK